MADDKDEKNNSVGVDSKEVEFQESKHEVDTYGPTSLEYFEQLRLEEKFNMSKTPTLTGGQMALFIGGVELVLHAAALYEAVHWKNFLLYKCPVWSSTSGYEYVYNHSGIMLLALYYFVPQTIIVEIFLNHMQWKAMKLLSLIEIATIIVYVIGWSSCNSHVELGFKRRSSNLHRTVASCCHIFFSISVLIAAIRLCARYCWNYLFKVRILGFFLRFVSKEAFKDTVIVLINVFSLIVSLSGLVEFSLMDEDLCLTTNGEKRQNVTLDGLVGSELVTEGSFNVINAATFLVVMFLAFEFVSFVKHHIRFHVKYITLEEFRDNFARFGDLGQYNLREKTTGLMLRGQPMPKVTSPMRMN